MKKTKPNYSYACDNEGGSGHSEATSRGRAPHSVGAAPSNTAPCNSNLGCPTQILRSGIDSLYLSYAGDITEETALRLKTLKDLARCKEPQDKKLAQYEAEGHIFETSDKGRSLFKYVLKDNWYRLDISGLTATTAPLAYVQIASEPLLYVGHDEVTATLDKIIKTLGQATFPANVSRVDLCVDFTTTAPLETISDLNWVTRAKNFSRYIDKRQFSGWSIGIGGDISARLYNKTLELEHSGKEYMHTVWAECGWDGVSPVWRLEFQFRRTVLRQLGVRSYTDLINHLGGLWLYACQDWLKLTTPSEKDKTQSRWPVQPVWQALQQVDWDLSEPVQRQAVTTYRLPCERSLYVNGLSGLTSYMASHGIVDTLEGIRSFYQAARHYHDSREYLTEKNFDDYIADKVALKTRSYNTMRNLPDDTGIHPVDTVVANEYRKRSDGE